MDQKCAPAKTFKDGSCFSLAALTAIAENYNKKNTKSPITITTDKQALVNQLSDKMKRQCDDQTCWLRTEFVAAIKNPDLAEEIQTQTFRPEGPKGKNDWLSTTHINEIVSQYQDKFPDFTFLGAVPADFEKLDILGIKDLDFDELKNSGKTKIGMVINLDNHYDSGSHWVALYTDLNKNQIYYFDSFAKKPSNSTKRFINKIVKYLYHKKYNKTININKVLKGGDNSKATLELKPFDIRYNTIQHQFDNSECGVYSSNFVIRLARGETFDDITQNITKDDEMNNCRKTYFRNVK